MHRILVKAGRAVPLSRPDPQPRRRRRPYEDMLMQTGGSQRLWLERWGPESVLLLAVDGNSGSVTQAVFRTVQDTRVYLILLESLTRQRGIPQPFTRPARSLQKQRLSKASACGIHPVRQGDAGTGHPIQQILTLSLLAKDGWNGWRKHPGPAVTELRRAVHGGRQYHRRRQ